MIECNYDTNDYVPHLIVDLSITIIGNMKCHQISNPLSPSFRRDTGVKHWTYDRCRRIGITLSTSRETLSLMFTHITTCKYNIRGQRALRDSQENRLTWQMCNFVFVNGYPTCLVFVWFNWLYYTIWSLFIKYNMSYRCISAHLQRFGVLISRPYVYVVNNKHHSDTPLLMSICMMAFHILFCF